MAKLKSIFKSVHNVANNTTVKAVLDSYLMGLPSTDMDRAIDVNAPSQIGVCLRARYYARKGYKPDEHSIEPKTRRVFDNGTCFHIRMQDYLKEAGVLLLDEVPVINEDFNIQGHTDGIMKLNKNDDELSILELKSINDNGFSSLVVAKENHILQGLTYAYCIEMRRFKLHLDYDSFEEFEEDRDCRYEKYASFYQHIKGGRKHTREEKIAFQCDLHNSLDTILMKCKMPVTKVHFVYENKNTQEIKEYIIDSKEEKYSKMLDSVLSECSYINDLCAKDQIPSREGTSKSCPTCHWCNFKTECWN